MFFTLYVSSFKNCSLKGSLGNTEWFSVVFLLKPLGAFHFKIVYALGSCIGVFGDFGTTKTSPDRSTITAYFQNRIAV